MAVDIARLGIEVDSSQVRSATADLARFQGTAQGVGREAQRVGGQMTAFLTAPILGAGAIAVKTAADYETLQVQLEVLLGSAEQAEQVFGRLSEFAATTPFELEGITRANNLLLGFGLNVEETFDLLQTLGDVSAVTGGSLFDMARVFGEARAEGNLLTRDLRQLVNQGVPAIQLLAESLGVAESEIFDMATAGEISFERLVAAFEKATEQGGLFFDGMGQRSDTLTGIFSNLADSVNLSLGSIGTTLVETLDIKGVTRELIADIEAATEWFNNLDASAQRMIFTLTGIVAAAGPVIAILGTLSLAIGAISAPVAATVAAVAIGTAAIIDHWEEIEAYFTTGGGAEMWEDLKSIVGSTIDIISGLWENFGGRIVHTAQTFTITAIELFSAWLDGVAILLDIWSLRWLTDWEGFLADVEQSFDDVFGEDGSLRNIFMSFVGWIAGDWVVQLAGKIGGAIGDSVLDLLRSIGLIGDSFPAITPKVDKFFETFEEDAQQAEETAQSLSNAVGSIVDTLAGISFDTGGTQQQESPIGFKNIRNDIEILHGELEKVPGEYESAAEAAGLVKDANEEISQSAQQLGFAFSSAFEDAIIRGESFREVLSGILEDIARIALRTAITQPLGEALAGGISDLNLFGGGKASGGPVQSGKYYMVGERGPELFAPGQSGAIIPNHKIGSTVNVNVINETGSQVEVQERQNSNGGVDIDLMIKRSVQDGFDRGTFDGPMSRNFGVTRKGRR